MIPKDVEGTRLLKAARGAARRAWAPYSRFRVGAALLCADGTVVTACNVENASYGLTLCAERAAVAKAVSEGRRRFRAIAVAALGKGGRNVRPCGACRQVLAEFGVPEVICDDGRYRLEDLLPSSFRFKAR